uniref:hypothetical protein n=1 Tax=uncultured Dysgonomonas sp. TaxID=206096 RepID=UPI002607051B|nr:hypothetical protein [uncultured Dysgonomonas sp.]
MKKQISKIMFGKIGFIISCLLIISCNNTKNENPNKEDDLVDYDIENRMKSDSMPYYLWYGRFGLVDETRIPKIKLLDELATMLELKTAKTRDSILSTVDTSKLVTIGGSTEYADILRKAMVTGDEEAYYTLQHNSQISFPYNVYIADKYGFAPAYRQTYDFIISMNESKLRKIKPKLEKSDIYNLDYVDNDKRNLALYSLIKGFKKGDIQNSLMMSIYFKEGLYFPKDMEMADTLYSVYHNYISP